MSERSVEAAEPGRIYGGESAGERAARRRELLLDAGLELFGTTGWRATTVRALCAQAGLTDRYFYAAFATTEDLLEAVYEREFGKLQQAMEAALAQPAARRSFATAARALLDAVFRMAADARVARVCWLEVLGVSPRIDALYNRNIGRYAAFIVQTAQGYLPGVLNLAPVEQQVLGVAAVGAVSESVKHWMLSGYREPRERMVAATARMFDGLMRQLRAEARQSAAPAGAIQTRRPRG